MGTRRSVLVLGNNGMLGHAVESILRSFKDIDVITSSKLGKKSSYKFNVITDNIEELLELIAPDYVINCIGIIKPRIIAGMSDSIREAIHINSVFPHNLFRATEGKNIKIIQIATDCVFSGLHGDYKEDALHDAHDVYGKTKSLGEVESENFLNLRVSIIGPENGRATSLLEWFLNQEKGAQLQGYSNHFWNGIGTYQFAKIALGIIREEQFVEGNFHLLPADKVSKFELLNIFREVYNRGDINISETVPEVVIDRTLSTLSPEKNQLFWGLANYSKVPTIREIVDEIKILSEA